MTYEEFVDALAARCQAVPGVLAVERRGGELALTMAGDATGTVNPRNAWRAVQTGEALAHVLDVQARTIAAMIASRGQLAPWAAAAPRIMTRLERPDLARQHERVARPWAITSALWEIVVEDAPTHMRGVLAADAAAWGQAPDALFDRGLRQLRQLAERGPRPRQMNARLWVMAAGDGYAASRLLLPDWLLAHLPARRAPRGWLCVAPARDMLALTPLGDLQDPGQVIAFAATVRALGQLAHPFPFAPLVLAEGAVRPLGGPVAAA